MWVAEKERQAAHRAIWLGMAVAGANIAMMLLSWRNQAHFRKCGNYLSDTTGTRPTRGT